MKTEIKPNAPKFKPCQLTITFETQKELDIFGSLFNMAQIASTFTELGASRPNLWSAAEQLGANVDNVANVRAILRRLLQ